MLLLALIGLAILTAIITPLIIVCFGGSFSYTVMVSTAILAIVANMAVGQSVYSYDNQNDAVATFFIVAFFDFVGLLAYGAICWAIKKDSR